MLIGEKVIIPAKYADFDNIFFKILAEVLPEQIGIKKYAINLVEGKQSYYRVIYSLRSMEFKTLKIYIKTNLANGFIRPSKSPASTPILFVCKANCSFCLYVNYQDLNNLTIQNQLQLLLIGEFLDWLGRAKCFTQLDLIQAYHKMRIKEDDKWKIVFRTCYGHFKY